MNRSKGLAAFLLAIAVVVTGAACDGGGPAAEGREGEAVAAEDEVVAAFEAYRSAALARAGDDAAALVGAETIDYYDDMRQLAMRATRDELRRRRIMDQMMVLMLRHLLDARELARMDGRDLVSFAVDEGLISETSVEKMEPGDVDVAGERAVLAIEIDGDRAPFTFLFVREGGDWKIELSELMGMADSAFQSLVNESGKSEEAFLMQLLTSRFGTKPGPRIWEPGASHLPR